MLGAGNTEAALEAVSAFPGGLQVGGGITASNCAKFLEAGASHVIVTRYVCWTCLIGVIEGL
jgi:phosphoribosylformimino-5-aminoimidazole carboxamide ribotide isomerase